LFPAQKAFKWLRCVTAADPVYGDGAAIYGIPCNAHAVLKIVPRTGEVTTLRNFIRSDGSTGVNPDLPGRWKWHGGQLAPDGNIYCAPANAERVLMILPRTGEVRLIGPALLPGVQQKWYGALVGFDGCVYCTPHNADAVLKIRPETGEVSTFGNLGLGGWKWHGCVRGRDGTLYGIPSHASRVLKIVPDTGTVCTIGEDIDSGPLWEDNRRWQVGKYKYGGGTLGPDGCVYCFPYDAHRVLKIDPNRGGEEEVSLLGIADGFAKDFECHNKWQNGFAGRDGCVYAIPVSAPAILKIDPASNEASSIGRDLCGPGLEKWEGGVVNPADGGLYCVPQNADMVLKINPPPRRHAATSETQLRVHPGSRRTGITDCSCLAGACSIS